VRSVRRLYNEFQIKPVSVRVFSSRPVQFEVSSRREVNAVTVSAQRRVNNTRGKKRANKTTNWDKEHIHKTRNQLVNN
jgi:hypothetical protein